MKRFYTFLGIVILLLFIQSKVFAKNVWINDLRSLYLSGNAIIYGINIRTFAAKDLDNDGIIAGNGEEKGNFINAIGRLNEMSDYGINTIDILPILPVGKKNALGTAGSLYAPSDFGKINPQLKAPKSPLTIENEMMTFINECHAKKIRVMVTLPTGASHDLYLTNSDLFLKDTYKKPIATNSKSDSYFLDGGDETDINSQVYKLYLIFIQKMISLGVDGIKVTTPEIMPNTFWKKLISETRLTEPQFLFLADSQQNSENVANLKKVSTDDLLSAGFDGYFENFGDYSQWSKPENLCDIVKKDINLIKKYNNQKRVTANLATLNQVSPILYKGLSLSNFIIWLQATLPVNSYFIDGFATGDDYLYPEANKLAKSSETDSSIYYVQKGKLDIYNFSRKPEGEYASLKPTFARGNQIKNSISKYTDNEIKFETYRTNNPNIIAFNRDLGKITIVFVGNTDFDKENKVSFKLKKDIVNVLPITNNTPTIKNGTLEATLEPGEVCVLLLINIFETE